MTTKYNIYFNGHNAFTDGLKATDNAAVDDFSDVIPLYTVSYPDATSAASTDMDRSIEKCRKCIKLHSIKTKPKPDPKRKGDPKYALFMQQEEYNPRMSDAWLLLAMSEFHKGDFVGSVGTFNYIIRHFQTDKDIIAQCQLWIVRAYAELGWLYEAEDLLSKVNQDDLQHRHSHLYAVASADLKLKQKQYAEALPFIKLALLEQSKYNKTRFNFILGQIYEQQKQDDKALAAYKKVINGSAPAEMDFSARMHRLLLSQNVKGLLKLARQPKNKDRLEYIYGAIGDIYIAKNDTTKALENYALAIEKATRATEQKAKVLVTAADIYYLQTNYAQAQPLYTEASSILTVEHDDYKRVLRRAETLSELVAQQQVVQLQDSLQILSRLSEEEQLKVAERIVAELIAAEKLEAERAAQAERDAQNSQLTSVNTSNMLGGGAASAEWYFYNTQLIRNGKQEFQRRWGNRSLEDDWRRRIKLSTAIVEDNTDDNENSSDSTQVATDKIMITDTKNPQYYLQQIPHTEADIQQSQQLIADALYNMVYIYQDKIEDEQLAHQTIEEIERRFPTDERLVDLYYVQYLNALKHQDNTSAIALRQLILSRFPNTQQASIVADEAYFDKLRLMQQQQDSIYNQTYELFKQGDYAKVKQNKDYAEQNFPLSRLMPRFLFLNAVSIAKTENQQHFIDALRDMVNRYPEHEMSAMAKDMLAMMSQGMESQADEGTSGLQEKREILQSDLPSDSAATQSFSIDKAERSLVMIIIDNDEQQLGNLLYQVALFNFTQFLIKDFDIRTMPMFSKTESAVILSGFEHYDETIWYSNLMRENAELTALLNTYSARIVRITEPNYSLLTTQYTLDDYRLFAQENGLE